MPFYGKIIGLLTAISGELLPDNVLMVLCMGFDGDISALYGALAHELKHNFC